jgi:hypothetical protein
MTSWAISTVPGAVGDELTSTDGTTVALGEAEGGSLGGAEDGWIVAVASGVALGVALGEGEAGAVLAGVTDAVLDGGGLVEAVGEGLRLSTETLSV